MNQGTTQLSLKNTCKLHCLGLILRVEGAHSQSMFCARDPSHGITAVKRQQFHLLYCYLLLCSYLLCNRGLRNTTWCPIIFLITDKIEFWNSSIVFAWNLPSLPFVPQGHQLDQPSSVARTTCLMCKYHGQSYICCANHVFETN